MLKKKVKKALGLLLSLTKKETKRIAKSKEAKELMKEFKDGAKYGETQIRKGVKQAKKKGVALSKDLYGKAKKKVAKRKTSKKKVTKKTTKRKATKKPVKRKTAKKRVIKKRR